MFKYLLLLSFSFIALSVYGQKDTLSKDEKHLLDSMFNNDEFIKLMKDHDKNHLDVSIGIGNGEFSEHNNAANATGTNKQLIYTPTVNYRLKNGLSFGISCFITGDSSGKAELYQTGLTAGYDYYGKSIQAGFSYTRFISDQHKYNSKSLYQNDLYGYLRMAKGIIQPGIVLGFANGNYKERNYVSFNRKIHLPNPPPSGRDTTITIKGLDSTDNKTSYFSVTVNAGHDFSFYKLLSKNDELDFTPSVMLNLGSDNLTQVHTDKIFDRPALSKRKRAEASNKFQAQSVAVSLDFTYTIKKFFIQPVVYFDYYLPSTTSNRLSTVFSVVAGVSF